MTVPSSSLFGLLPSLSLLVIEVSLSRQFLFFLCLSGSVGGVSFYCTVLFYAHAHLLFSCCRDFFRKVRRHVQQKRAHRHLHAAGARSHHHALQAKKGTPRVEEEDQVRGCRFRTNSSIVRTGSSETAWGAWCAPFLPCLESFDHWPLSSQPNDDASHMAILGPRMVILSRRSNKKLPLQQ